MPLAGRVVASDFHTRVVPGAGPGAMSGGAVAPSAVSSGTRWEAWVVSASPGTLGLRSGGFESKTATMPILGSQLRLPKLGSTELPKLGTIEESLTALDGDDGGRGGNVAAAAAKASATAAAAGAAAAAAADIAAAAVASLWARPGATSARP